MWYYPKHQEICMLMAQSLVVIEFININTITYSSINNRNKLNKSIDIKNQVKSYKIGKFNLMYMCIYSFFYSFIHLFSF
jgi:hypothetical protein